MRHFDPDELPDRDLTPDWDVEPDDDDLPDVAEPDTGFNPNHEDDDPPVDWERHAQAVRDGDKQAIGEAMLSRADQLKSEMKDRGEW